MVSDAEKQALSATTLLVFKEKRPTVCFVCLGEKSLPFEKQVYSFVTPGDLTKHFKRKYLANIRPRNRIWYKICRIFLKYMIYFQNHIIRIHGTIS